jgi:hypothetical protein
MVKRPQKRHGPIGLMRHNRTFRRIVIALAVLPFAYALSTGPVICLTVNSFARGGAEDDTFARSLCKGYLAPALIVYESGPQPLPRMLDWYVSLFPAPPPPVIHLLRRDPDDRMTALAQDPMGTPLDWARH